LLSDAGDAMRSFIQGEPPAISPRELRRMLVSGTAGWM
jgi:hypothetical protein